MSRKSFAKIIMAQGKQAKKDDPSTEEKIKEAARKVFTQKGYSAARTRDIAEEAGINLALLNYYFRSKEKLFNLIMEEKIHKLFGGLFPILNDGKSSLNEKVERITEFYIDSISQNPDLPLFVLSEIRNNPGHFAEIIQARLLIFKSHWMRQLKEKRPDINPLQFMLSILGMIVFPFIARPVFESSEIMDKEKIKGMLMERKKLIPIWVNAMLNAK